MAHSVVVPAFCNVEQRPRVQRFAYVAVCGLHRKCMLQRYGTANHTGGITEFALLAGAILLIFRRGAAYLYTDEVPGSARVERMRELAVQGKGLSTYVSRHIGTRYAQMLSVAEVAAVRAQVNGATGGVAASAAVRP